MKIGMASLTFRNHSIEEVIRIARTAGIDGIEWGVREGHAFNDENIEIIRLLSAKKGIEIFSLGSYCRMTDDEECKKTVDMAVRLSAPVIRIWAGKKSPWDCSEEDFKQVVDRTRKMADYAGKFGIILGFEYHRYSLTETAESAVRLVKAIDRENVRLYWQIDERVGYEQNLKNLQMVTPYLAGIFHLQNYSAEGKCLLLEEISDELEGYLKPFKDTDVKVLIEFVKDGSEESFYQDVTVVKRIMEMVWQEESRTMYQLEIARNWAYFDLTEEIAMQWIDAGIHKIELSLSRPPVDFDDEEFVGKINRCKEVVDKCGIEILSVHLPFGPDWELCSCDDQIRDRAVSRYVEIIQYCNRLHPKRYVLHPGYPHVPDGERAQRMKNFRHSVSVLAEVARPAKIAVENMAYDCLGNTSDELISLVDGLDNICVCCDMNHWLHEKNYDAIRKLGSRIETIHVSDYDEIQEKHWLPGKGVSDWNKIIEALCSIGYNGPFLYECVGTGEVLAENKKMLFDAYYKSR